MFIIIIIKYIKTFPYCVYYLLPFFFCGLYTAAYFKKFNKKNYLFEDCNKTYENYLHFVVYANRSTVFVHCQILHTDLVAHVNDQVPPILQHLIYFQIHQEQYIFKNKIKIKIFISSRPAHYYLL